MAVNILFAVLLLASAYGGYADPHMCLWIVMLTLLFPVLLGINVLFVLGWLLTFSRKWLVSFCAILLCTCQMRTYCPVNMPQPIPKGSVKVISYNVFGFGGMPIDTAEYFKTLDYLSNSDADIFCAQEAHLSTNRMKTVEKYISHWKYRDTTCLGKGGSTLMICTNFPIIDKHLLPSPSDFFGGVAYRLRAGRDTIHVVNCHFISNRMNPDDKEAYNSLLTSNETDSINEKVLNICRKINRAGVMRAVQADTMAEYINSLGDVPLIVCGDFNDSPLSYPHHRLTQTLDDAYTRSGNGPGITYNRSAMFVRLDNILCSHHWRSFGAKVATQNKMSDHYPVEVWLKRIK